jgi:hypothetical protein
LPGLYAPIGRPSIPPEKLLRAGDDGEAACGRGWVTLGTAGRPVGHFCIHKGDDPGFVCERD